jgi:hypothetical protein
MQMRSKSCQHYGKNQSFRGKKQSGLSPLIRYIPPTRFMKNDSTTTFLNFVLAALVILGVVFALFNIWRVHKLRSVQPRAQMQAQAFQQDSQKMQALLNDTIVYNNTAKSPELTQLLKLLSTPAPAAK